VDTHQRSAAQIQWRSDLLQRFGRPGDDPGNVNGERWCSGTLISADQFLTAGHCFLPDLNGWRTPRRMVGNALKRLTPPELAPLMVVNFNYQVDGADPKGQRIRVPDTYPIVRLVEHGLDPALGNLDYAIIELGRDVRGRHPGDDYRIALLDASQSTLQGLTLVTLIQHPNGYPKKIEAGAGVTLTTSYLEYDDLDTEGGSSGAGAFSQDGRVVGVHVEGGCKASKGEGNKAVTLKAISAQSAIIK
jgi:V8-like Glu-specific endopeptidase